MISMNNFVLLDNTNLALSKPSIKLVIPDI